MTAKRKISVSPDEDVLEELEQDPEATSVRVNNALRDLVKRRRRRRLLFELLDELEEARGGIDDALVEKYSALLQ